MPSARGVERSLSATDTILDVRDLSVQFVTPAGLLRRHIVRAVDGVSLQLRRGESLGLVGESGSGKTTLSRAVVKLTRPTSGSILFEGKDIGRQSTRTRKEYRKRVQMIFQDPYESLNPRSSVRHAVEEPMLIHHVIGDKAGRAEKVSELLKTVGLNPTTVLNKYPHELSGGERQRVSLARALSLSPELLIADEPVSMLDVSVRLSILNLLAELVQQQDLALLYITHDIASARYFAERLLVMYAGEVVEAGPAEEITQSPAHPYTQLLVSAAPDPDASARGGRQPMLAPGENPSLINPPAGCRFHPRCPRAMDICAREQPAKFAINDAHWAACWLFRDRRPVEELPPPEPPVRHTGPSGTVREPAPATRNTPGQVSKGASHGN